jgi:hypothetical protein
VRVLTSTSGCVVWDFARENGVGSCPAVGVDGRVNSAEGFGLVCFKGGSRSVNWWTL